MKYIVILFMAVSFLFSCKNKQEEARAMQEKTKQDSITALGDWAKDSVNEGIKRYDVASGIVRYFVDFGKKDTSTRFLIFDRNGGRQLRKSPFSLVLDKDGFTYFINPGDSVGTKMYTKHEDQFNPDQFDFKELPLHMKQRFRYKEIGSGKILNRDCKMVQLENGEMNIRGKYWLYKYIPLKMEITIMNHTSTYTAVSFDENAVIDPHAFDLPAKIEIVKVAN